MGPKRFVFSSMLFFAAMAGCRDNPSLPKLTPINEAVIRGMDSIYMIGVYDTLSIYPEVSFTQDTALTDPSRYRYEWIFIVRPTIGINYDYRTISTDTALINYLISEDIFAIMGVYDFTFRVIDTHTDTFTEFPFRVILGNSYYEGWMVLNDVQGETRVDMLSYYSPSDTFTYLPAVIDLPRDGNGSVGKPVFVDMVFGLDRALISGGILVGTDQGVNAFSSDDLSGVFDYYQKYSVLRRVPDLAKRSAVFQGAVYNQYLYVGDAWYQCYEQDYREGQFQPINWVAADGGYREFRAAPFIARNRRGLFDVSVLFNEDADIFVWHGEEEEPCTPLHAANAFDHQLSWSLVYLEYTHVGGGQYVALLRESVTSDLYYLKFTLYDLLEFSRVPPGSGLYQTNHMVLDPHTGRLYFGIGNTLFEYSATGDRSVTNFDDEITLLKFQQYLTLIEFQTGATVNKDRYEQYEKLLLVATHNAAKPEDSGRLILYDPIGKRPFQEFGGFAKIVDVSYKER